MVATFSIVGTADGELYFGTFLNHYLEGLTLKELLLRLKEIADDNNIKYSDIMVYGDSL